MKNHILQCTPHREVNIGVARQRTPGKEATYQRYGGLTPFSVINNHHYTLLNISKQQDNL